MWMSKWVNCMHIKEWTTKSWRPGILYIQIYNYCRPRKINSKLRTAWVDEIKKKHTDILVISFWIEKSTSLLILALYLLKEIANIGKKKLYMYLHEVPDTLYVSQVNILKLSWTKCPTKYNSVILSEHRHELF